MAVIPTGAIYKTLNFDGQSSGTYGVYITGDAVFNAPERDVEIIKIPGRNGAFALDNGRFENIEVTYPAGIFAETEADFAAAISDFRNYLCSRKGYCRLTDDYNPDEYRLGIYKSGLEVNPEFLKAGQFNITFECKPQRYLTTGENPITVTSGDTITNPTRFDSSPIFEIDGYGAINVNDNHINVENVLIGDISVTAPWERNEYGYILQTTYTINLTNTSLLNAGDTISLKDARDTFAIKLPKNNPQNVNVIYNTRTNIKVTHTLSAPYMVFNIALDEIEFQYGTPFSWTAELDVAVTMTGAGAIGDEIITINYSGGDTIDITLSLLPASDSRQLLIPSFIGNSTQIATSTKYIDFDIGEAYIMDHGETILINNSVQLGSDLLKLTPGENEITFDNTITNLNIVPKWWKV